MNLKSFNKLSFAEYLFYANTSLITWVLFVPYIVFVVDFQAFYIILFAATLQITCHSEYIRGINFEKKESQFTKRYWLSHPVRYNIRKVAAKAFLIGFAALPAISSHTVASVLNDILTSQGTPLNKTWIQLLFISLVFSLSLISQKVMNIVTRILSLPIILYTALLLILLFVVSILPNFDSLSLGMQSIDIANLSFWKWFVFAYFFINSMNSAMVFDRLPGKSIKEKNNYSAAHILSRGLLLILVLLGFGYSYMWVNLDADNRLTFDVIEGFAIQGWSTQSAQLGFSFLIISLFIILASVFLTLPQYIVNRSHENLFPPVFHKSSYAPNNFATISVFVLSVFFVFFDFNFLVVMASSMIMTTYAAFFLYMIIRRRNNLLRIYYAVLFIIHVALITVVSWGEWFWVWPLLICVLYLTQYLDPQLKKMKSRWDDFTEIYKKFGRRMIYNKDVTLTQLVTTQTIVVFVVIFVLALSSWIFPRGFEKELQPVFWDLSLAVMILLYYTAIIAISFFMIPKIENYERVKDKLEITNKHLIEDIRKRKSVENDLIYTSTHDSLTSTYNRDFIIEKIIYFLKTATHFDIIFVDIDKFKQINDFYGHSTGDAMLKKIAVNIRDVFGKNVMISRYGGDEFMLLIKGESRSNILQKCRKIIAIFGEPVFYRGKNISLTVSLGIFHYKGQEIGLNTILKNVDFALRYAKNQDVDKCVEYTESIDQLYQERLSIEDDIREKLRSDGFCPFYQPIIDSEKKNIVGFEQLLRIKKDDVYVLPPEYISIAEESGLIEPLGWNMLQKACEQLQLFSKNGMADIYISVNISSNQFIRSNFVKRLKSMCNKYNVKPSNLRLEITESILLEDSEDVRGIMNELTWNNFLLYLDDFGTGFSNMSYLKKLPIDTLKIDQSFVQQEESASRAVISAIASLAKELSIKLIAEGVESKKQAAFLQKRNITTLQGYLFARPMAPALLVDYYQNFEYN